MLGFLSGLFGGGSSDPSLPDGFVNEDGTPDWGAIDGPGDDDESSSDND